MARLSQRCDCSKVLRLRNVTRTIAVARSTLFAFSLVERLLTLSRENINTGLRIIFPSTLLKNLLTSLLPYSLHLLKLQLSSSNLLFPTMAPKRKSTILTVHGSYVVSVPTSRHPWSGNPMVKDYF